MESLVLQCGLNVGDASTLDERRQADDRLRPDLLWGLIEEDPVGVRRWDFTLGEVAFVACLCYEEKK